MIAYYAEEIALKHEQNIIEFEGKLQFLMGFSAIGLLNCLLVYEFQPCVVTTSCLPLFLIVIYLVNFVLYVFFQKLY